MVAIERSSAATPGPSDFVAGLSALLIALGVAWSLTDYARPAWALAAGILLALAVPHPFSKPVGTASKFLLRASVVALGFGVPLSLLRLAGVAGILVTSFGVFMGVACGLAWGALLAVEEQASWLITIGTAICGGSAIAALGGAIRARAEAMAVALGTVFVLNSVALWIFPPLGHAFHLSQLEFGVWASIGIHDTASVVGAASAYGAESLQVATVLKLARTLWIVPLVIGAITWRHRRGGVAVGEKRPSLRQAFPLFILLFLGAAIIAVLLPTGRPLYAWIGGMARRTLTTTLFLIGCSLSRSALRSVGPRPLLQGIGTWIVLTCVSLVAARSFF